MHQRFDAFTPWQLVSITLIALIVALLAVGGFLTTLEKVRIAEACNILHDIVVAEQLYRYERGTYCNAPDGAMLEALFSITIPKEAFTYQVTDATDTTFTARATRAVGLYRDKEITLNNKGVLTLYTP